jgi:DNA-directed RNA polymerase sigma subunit (sigma70/sigma32)
MAVQALEVIRSTGRPDDRHEGEDTPLASMVDERGKGVEDALIEADDMERIASGLGRLPEREAMILRMRFGLGIGLP